MAQLRHAVLIYAVAFVVAGTTPFLLLPLLTKLLTPHQFGEITAFLILTALLGNLAGMSAHGYVSVRYFKGATDQFGILVSSSIWAISLIHVLTLLILVLFYPLMKGTFGLTLGYTVLAVLTALILNINLIFLAIFQSSGQPWLYLHSRILQGAVELCFCIALIYLVVADASARIYSYTLALTASACLGLFYCMRRGFFGMNMKTTHMVGLLHFGVPMMPHVVAGTAITYIDRLVISSLLGTESLGIYMVAMQVGMAMIAFIEPLNKALAPWLFEQLAKGEKDLRRMIVKRTYQLFLMLFLVGAFVAIVSYFFFNQFIGANYSDARILMPWMVAGFVMQGLYYTQVNYMFYAERTGTLSLVTGSSAILGCLVSYLLTTAFGLQGAAVSFLINNSMLFILVWVVASKAVPMPWFGARNI